MSTRQSSQTLWLAGMLGVLAVGCADPSREVSDPEGGTGGTDSAGGAPALHGGAGAPSSGGAGASTSGGQLGGGGTLAGGGTSSGGTPGAGGTSSGGTPGSGGASSGGASGGGTSGGGTSGGGTSGASGGSEGGSALTMGGTGGAGEPGGASPSGGAAGAAGTAPQAGSGGVTGAGGAAGTTGSGGSDVPPTCTSSQATGTSFRGSGPHAVIVETNADPGISEGTIYRPADLGGDEKYPIFVWGEGACSLDGLSNANAMAEIASHGYFVVADGTPNGSGNRPMDRSDLPAMAAPLLAYIGWAIAENEKPCSAYYQSLEPTKAAANGFSCGGLMSQATAGDPRILTWGVTSSGMAGADPTYYDSIDTPVFFVEGGASDSAYNGGLEGYQNTVERGVPVLWLSKDLGHGGDLLQANGGDFTRINLAWLNWWLKGDETATGKGLLVGAGCPYCSDGSWDVRSANLP